MPVQRCTQNGKPGYKWGETGVCYTYTPSDPGSRAEARLKAEKQGAAIQAAQKRRERGG